MNRYRGPPGVGLDVSGSGFAGCPEVVISFDAARIGSARPDPAGDFHVRHLAVPGDAGLGTHELDIGCPSSAASRRSSATFVVTDAPIHRMAIATSLGRPDQLLRSPAAIAASAGLALLLVLLLAFPSQLFNSTYEANQDEIRGWFGRSRAFSPRTSGSGFSIAAFVAVGALLYGFLSPGFGWDRSSLALFLGLAVAVAVVCLGFQLPGGLYVRRLYGEWGRMVLIPGSILVAAVCVAASRLVRFQPGYLYGLLAGLAFKRRLTHADEGRMAAVSAVAMLVVGVAAWVARGPVSLAAAKPSAGFALFALEAFLGATFLLATESLLVGMLPLRFLDGGRILAWSRTAWVLLATTAAFLVVHVLLRAGSGYVGHGHKPAMVAAFALYVTFGLLSVSFWGYFRFRPARERPDLAESS